MNSLSGAGSGCLTKEGADSETFSEDRYLRVSRAGKQTKNLSLLAPALSFWDDRAGLAFQVSCSLINVTIPTPGYSEKIFG